MTDQPPPQSPPSPMPQTPLALAYEPPQPKAANANLAIVLIAMFICGSSAGIFAIEAEGHRYRASSGVDSWPAAVAVLGLALMGISIAFFLTRRR